MASRLSRFRRHLEGLPPAEVRKIYCRELSSDHHLTQTPGIDEPNTEDMINALVDGLQRLIYESERSD
jgi:hypothetical protein